MNTVIMICDDPRIVLVKEAIQPLLSAKISILPDFDTGLKEVFERRPQVVFIQDEIAGVKGEAVTRHIRSLLQANAPHLIQLGHTPPGFEAVRDFSDSINLNLPNDELIASFREQLERLSDVRWKEDVSKPADSETNDAMPEAAYDGASLSFSTPVAPPSAPSVERTASPSIEKPSAAPPAPNLSSRSERQALPPSDPEPLSHPKAAPPVGMTEVTTEEPPFAAMPASSVRWRRTALLVGVGVLVAIICVALYLLALSGKKPRVVAAPVKYSIPVAPPQKRLISGAVQRQFLPSFIPKEGLDTTYGAAKPGWERYVSPRHEYLLFREEGKFRVLQVIALQPGAIDIPFVSSLLREICGATTTVIKSRTGRDGYDIEQGEASKGAEVIFYKKKGTGETRGVVISLP